MERDFEYGSRKFKLSKLDPFKQLHVVRRIAPILNDMLPALKDSGALKGGLKEIEGLPESEKLDMVVKVISPIMMGMSKLTDEDTEIVVHGLLEAVEMQQPTGNWVKISTGKMLMVQDMDLPVLLNLAGRSFMFNLARFFSVLPQ